MHDISGDFDTLSEEAPSDITKSFVTPTSTTTNTALKANQFLNLSNTPTTNDIISTTNPIITITNPSNSIIHLSSNPHLISQMLDDMHHVPNSMHAKSCNISPTLSHSNCMQLDEIIPYFPISPILINDNLTENAQN